MKTHVLSGSRRTCKAFLSLFFTFSLCFLSLQVVYGAGENGSSARPPISGIKTIGPSGCDYTTIAAALADVQTNGLSGHTFLELDQAYTGAGESFPVVFTNLGTSAGNTLTLRPRSTVTSAISISGSSATAILDLNGAQHVIIDGRPGGTGSDKLLSIANTNTSGAAVRLINDASYNKIKYCLLNGVTTSSAAGVVLFSTSATGSTGNDYNAISWCDIHNGATTPATGIYSSGSAIQTNDYDTVANCRIYNFFNSGVSSAGIYISTGSGGWTVTGNHIFQEAGRINGASGNLHYGIRIDNSSGNEFTVTNNYIGGSTDNAQGTAWNLSGSSGRFVGIFMNTGSESGSTVQGNTITNFSITSSNGTTTGSGAFSGIYVNTGAVTINGNTVGSSSGNGAIALNFSAAGLTNGIGGGVTVTNNTVGGITVSGSGSGTFQGIVNSSTTGNISNNLIGSTSTTNSIQTSATSTGAINMYGITSGAAGTKTISGNVISNLTNNYSGTSTSLTRGINTSGGINVISGNTVQNLVSFAGSTGTGASANLIGILQSATSAGEIINGNIIRNLHNGHSSANVNVTGIFCASSATGDNQVSGNFVHSLNASSSGLAVLRGIMITSGAITFANNMIRLGIDSAGNSITANYSIMGFSETGGDNNYYHNSVYIGGDGVTGTTGATYAFNSAGGARRNFYNNIFTNFRSNSTATTTHYVLALNINSSTTGLAMDHNLYYAGGTGGAIILYNSQKMTDINAWKAAFGVDLNSGYADPKFVNAAGNSASVDLHLQNSSPAEGAGTLVAAVTNDYDGDARSSMTPVDIGADAAQVTPQDIFAPVITYSGPANSASTANRIITDVSITDIGTGVPVSGALRPRIWYRQTYPSVSSWASTAGTLTSGDGNNGVWNFTIDYSLLGVTPANGDSVQFYIVAQDQATSPQAGYLPVSGASHSDVNTQLISSLSPFSYAIVTALPAVIEVGSGKTYTSLTGAGGLFQAINTQVLTANTIVNITSNLSEDGTYALKGKHFDGYTLTIQPDAGTVRTISNSSDLAVAMIRLNGVKGMIIDGRFSAAGQYIRFVNTHATPATCKSALLIDSSCSSLTMRNCIVETNASANNIGNIQIGTGRNRGITIQQNDIRNAQGSPGIAGNNGAGIYSFSLYNQLSVLDNNIYNFTSAGLNLNTTDDSCVVKGNSFYCNLVTPPAAAQVGISVQSANGHVISDNYIGGSAPQCAGTPWVNAMTGGTFQGISLSTDDEKATSIQNNRISNIQLTGTGGVNLYGIYVAGGNMNIGTETGNIIGDPVNANSLQNAGASATSITGGIMNNAGSGTVVISNNIIANSVHTGTTTNIGHRGISNTASGKVTISNNTIYGLTSYASTNTPLTAGVLGIYNSSANTDVLIEGNTIYDLNNLHASATNYSLGIVATGSGGGTVARNRIYDLRNISPAGYLIGINVANGIWKVSNNQVALVNGSNTNATIIYGIYDNNSVITNTLSSYYNSIYIGGSAASGASNSFAYYKTTANPVTMKNNLFYNERTGGTGLHVVTGNSGSSWTAGGSDYNTFVAADTSVLATWNGSIISYSQWRTNTGGEQSSLPARTADVPSGSLFQSAPAGDLNINPNNEVSWYVNGKGVQIASGSSDFGTASAVRSTTIAGGGTDIGADEFTPAIAPANMVVTGSHTNSGTEELWFAGRRLARITWGATGSLPTLSAYKYYSGTAPNDATNGGTVTGRLYMNCYWVINATGGSGYSYDITLFYDDALLGTVTSEAAMQMGKKETGINGTWNYMPATVNTAENSITVTGLTSFSEFTGTDVSVPLPVQLLSFTAQAKGKDVLVRWSTSSEVSNDRFVIERSEDGRNYTAIGSVKGKGNSNSLNNYSFTDAGAMSLHSATSYLYYRLRQIDIDGTSKNSPVATVQLAGSAGKAEQAYPNPFTDKVGINMILTKAQMVDVRVTDANGNVVLTTRVQQPAGKAILSVPGVARLRAGVYILHLRCGEVTVSQKIVKLTDR